MMAELPIACSDFPFLRQVVVGNGIGATFDPADPASLAEAVRTIAGDERITARLARVKRRYSWEQEEQRFLAVYRSLET
jgi:glycosyltransferase involved in cell wall biosynthesis